MRKIIWVSMGFALMACACTLHASNLVRNGDFDTDTSGWTTATTTPVFELNDRDGIPDAPSLHIAGNADVTGGFAESPCIAVDTTTHFDLRAFTRVDAGAAAMGILEFADTACTTPLNEGVSDAISADGRWHDMEFNDLPLQDGTQGVIVAVVAEVDPNAAVVAPGDALFDHIRFGRTGTIDDVGINLGQEGLTGTWYDPATSGQGFEFSFTNAHAGDASWPIFGAWFTYDLPTDDPAGQRWYSMQGATTPGSTTGDVVIYRNVGGNFDAPPSTSATPVGTGTIIFFSCSSGLFTYTMDDGRTGIFPLHNLLSQGECTAGPPSGSAIPNDFGLSGVYYDPSKSGQGLMVEVDPDNSAVFLGWYTYAIDGSTQAESQRWLSAEGNWESGGDSADLIINASTGGGFATDEIVDTEPVGSAVITFTSCSSVTFDYEIDEGEFSGRSGTMTLTRLGAALESCPFDQ